MVTSKLLFNQTARDHCTAKLTQNYPSQKLTKKRGYQSQENAAIDKINDNSAIY